MGKWTVVTRDNFAATLPQVLEDISNADFVTMDTELTGLHLTRAHRNSILDDLTARYAKMRECVMNFGLLQVGLSCFSWNEARAKYSITAYSFYVFPSAANSLQQDRKFACQLGSLVFLSEFGFDFNKAFKEGIPFITLREEATIKANSAFYRESQNGGGEPAATEKPLILLKDDEKTLVSDIFRQIDEWIGKDVSSGDGLSDGLSDGLDLPPLNSYQRLILYQQIPLKYGDRLTMGKKTATVLNIRLADTDPEARAVALAEEKAQFDRVLGEQIGFRRVIDHIVERGTPIIGHNCFIDLLHLHHKFFDSVLPLQLSEFKSSLLAKFPVLVDTKFLARRCNGIAGTSLSDLTALAGKYPDYSYFCKRDSAGDEVEATNQFHDAGFDSICTGRAFLVLVNHFLKNDIITTADNPLSLTTSKTLVDQIIARPDGPLANRLNMLQSDDVCLWLKGQEVEPDRSHVLYVYALTPNTPASELQAVLAKLVSAATIHCQIHWLNDSTCFVQFDMTEMAEAVLAGFSANPDALRATAPHARIIRYREYQEKRDGELQESADQSRKRTRKQ